MGFVLTGQREKQHNHSFEHCGRMMIRDNMLRIILDKVGIYEIEQYRARVVLASLGHTNISACWSEDPVQLPETKNGRSCGVARLSESRKGFYMTIEGLTYVTPADRVRKVLCGNHAKAAVFRFIPAASSEEGTSVCSSALPDCQITRDNISN